jgi:hypothetical protein
MSLNKPFALIAIAALWAAALALTPCATLADDESAIFGGLRVAEINATPARAGEMTILTFAVENLGIDPVRITGARLPDGAPSRVMGALGSALSGEMHAVRVDPDETERLDGRTAWIEVGPLARDLEAGTVVLGRLLLGDYEAPVAIHVGPSAPSELASKSMIGSRSIEQGSAGC